MMNIPSLISPMNLIDERASGEVVQEYLVTKPVA